MRPASIAAAVIVIMMCVCASAVCAETTCPAQQGDKAVNSMEKRILRRSLVGLGDTVRLQRVMARARAGEKITVGVIGGSITAGASASSWELNYGSLMAKWWREAFPKANVEFVNAGIGATGSHYGCLRYMRDLGSRQPDFVIVEFGVNDPDEQKHAETYEGLVRQILKQPKSPAVMLLFTMLNNGGNSQERQSKIGEHYGLPMVSFRDALWPEVKDANIKWDDIEADIVHPNDRGHAYIAQIITNALAQVAALPQPEKLASVKPIPKALLTDVFEHTALCEGDGLVPVANTGWALATENGRRGWRADKPGSVIEFGLTGTAVMMLELHIKGPMGKAKVQVDDLPAEVVDAWFDQTWGGYPLAHILAKDLKQGKHRVRVELLEDKNPQSTGNQFVIYAIGAAGVE